MEKERREEIEKLLSGENKARLDGMDHKDVVPQLYNAAQDLLAELKAYETPAPAPVAAEPEPAKPAAS